MPTGRGKKKEEGLGVQATAAYNQVQPTPLESKLEASSLAFLNDMSSGKDVKDIEALKPYTNIYNSATSDQQNDRKSNGLLDATGAGGGAAQAYGAYLKYKRQQDAAGQLENAYNMTNAQVTGSIAPMLIGQANQRNMGRAGLAQQAFTSYQNRPADQGFWSTFKRSFGQSLGNTLGGAPAGALG